MKRKGLSLLLILGMVFVFAGISLAEVPPPPANQLAGFADIPFDDLEADDCLVCHTNTVDGHHVLYGSTIPLGICSQANGTCDVSGDPCVELADCTNPADTACNPGTPGTCITDESCLQDINQCNLQGQPCPVGLCEDGLTACTIDGPDGECAGILGETCDAGACPSSWTGQYCGQPICYGASAVADEDADSDGVDDTVYSCLSCHIEDTSTGVIDFLVIRDCTECHQQVLNTPTVHHQDELGDAKNAICTSCHGDLVDDALGCAETAQNVCSIQLDGLDILCEDDTICTTLAIGTCVPAPSCDHDIPTYTPSMVTPAPVTHGEAICDDGVTPCPGGWECGAGTCIQQPTPAGGCNFCHDAGTDNSTGSALAVIDNHDTHHGSGVYKTRLGGSDSDICLWCHKAGNPHNPGGEDPDNIRWCENCHGLESLHNIQVDSPNAANIGTIVVGAEDAYYGHIGRDDATDPLNNSDCWGCHGFSLATVPPAAGAIIPSLGSADKDTVIAGEATALTLSGVAFINGEYTSIVEVLAGDDVVATVTPDSISLNSLACTIPALDVGNYKVRVKKDDVVSNPVAVKCIPGLDITDVACDGGILTVTGSGFGDEAPEGAEEFINVKMGTNALDIISWTDTEIQAATDACGGSVTVNGLFGSASTGCNGNFDADEDVDGSDLALFKIDFGRNGWNNECTAGASCNGDFDCDGDVDGTDVVGIKADFGRNVWNNSCPQETAAACGY